MVFLEGTRGVYRPIKVLFDTDIYERALQICWTLSSYKSQIAVMLELLCLQQKNQIPSQVTAEDMIDLIREQSRNTLRERLWEFELEDFDEEDAKPLLKLVWAVNVCNKMRDILFEAKLLLETPDAIPASFRDPVVLKTARDYARILRKRQQEDPRSKTFSPQEVVLEVIPRVLQGFWVLPRRSLLNMASKKLSQMSISVTKAVLDQVLSTLSNNAACQVDFSRIARDEIVQSILEEIRQTHPLDTLKKMLGNFEPALLTEIVSVAVKKICEVFQPQNVEELLLVKRPATTPVQDQFNLAVTEEQPTTCADVVSSPSAPPVPPAELITVIQTKEEESSSNEPTSVGKSATSQDAAPPAPPAEQPLVTVVQAREEESSSNEPTSVGESATSLDEAPPAPPAEQPLVTVVQVEEDLHEESSMETGGVCTDELPSAVVPLTALDEPVVISTTDSEVKVTHGTDAVGFFSWFLQPFCFCFNCA